MEQHRSEPLLTSRRILLSTMAVGAAGALAGCLGNDEPHPDPVSLDDGQSCDNCDMVIEMHAGPAGQAYYLDDPPSDLPEDRDDGLAWFCSANCTYTYTLEHAETEAEPAVTYLTDYSTVSFDVTSEGDEKTISAHLDAAVFADAAALTFVLDSEVEGAMGGSLIGFSAAEDAENFAAEYGGELFTHGEITLEVVSALGM